MGTGGHLFVVRGHVEALQWEAALVGADRQCSIDVADRPLFPSGPPPVPRTWPEGWGRSGEPNVWMVQSHDGSVEDVLTHLRRALADVATAGLVPAAGREVPLVAVPLLGIPSAGDTRAHQWLRNLIETLREAAREHAHDIVLITQDTAEHAAAQTLRREHSQLDPAAERAAADLGARARAGSLALFLGSSWARGAGVPDRAELIDGLVEENEGTAGQDLSGLTLDERSRLVVLHDEDGTRRHLVRALSAVERPGLVHALVASLATDEVVTTAQDSLLVRAGADALGTAPALLTPTSQVEGGRWIAPLRGHVAEPSSLTLTAPQTPGATTALLRGLTLTRHLLVIGSHLDEPELTTALRHPGDPFPGRRCGTYLDGEASGQQGRAALWGDRLARVRLGGDDVSPARALEIFLDRVGMHAADSSTWLLDERFASLLAPRDQVYATQLRSVLGLLPHASSTWAPLTEHVQQLGG